MGCSSETARRQQTPAGLGLERTSKLMHGPEPVPGRFRFDRAGQAQPDDLSPGETGIEAQPAGGPKSQREAGRRRPREGSGELARSWRQAADSWQAGRAGHDLIDRVDSQLRCGDKATLDRLRAGEAAINEAYVALRGEQKQTLSKLAAGSVSALGESVLSGSPLPALPRRETHQRVAF